MTNNPLSVSLYVHIPFCRKKCDYCDFYSIPRGTETKPVSDAYIDSLIAEAAFYKQKYNISSWKTIYAGGGTPSLLSPDQLSKLISSLCSLSLNPPEEITVEMNPESLTLAHIKSAQESGVTRLSLGIQSLDDKVLEGVHRGCTSKQALEALDLLKESWKGRLSCDLIAGLPFQSKKSLLSSIEKLASYQGIDHISLYTLTVEEGTPLARRIEKGEVDWDDSSADRLWLSGRNALEKKGFFQYEVSNFSKPGYESVHNQTYWHLDDYIGIGSGASGTVYATGKVNCGLETPLENGLRWTNTTDIHEYCAFWNVGADELSVDEKSIPRATEFLDLKTEEFEFLMMGFRLRSGISGHIFENRFHDSLPSRAGLDGGTAEIWHKKRLLSVKKEGGDLVLALNCRGILLLNRFLEELL